MGDGRDALLLQKGRLAHQCAGGDKERPLLRPPLEAGQDMPAEDGGAAARPGAAALHSLLGGIVEDAAAVHMVLEQQSLRRQQVAEELAPHMAEVAGVDAVEVLRSAAGILQIVQKGGCGRRGHGRAHVVDVFYLIVLHPPEGDGTELHPLARRPQQAGARRRGRPLGRGRPHRTVAQRRAELALCRAEMAGRHGQQAVGHPGAAQRRAEAQRLGHRAARAEQAREGDAKLPHGVAGCGALGLQVPRQHEADLFGGRLGLFKAEPRRLQGQLLFGGFPAGLAEEVVGAQRIEAGGEGAFALLFAADGRMRRHDGRRREQKGISAACGHTVSSFMGLILSAFCGILGFRQADAIFAPSPAYSGQRAVLSKQPADAAVEHRC